METVENCLIFQQKKLLHNTIAHKVKASAHSFELSENLRILAAYAFFFSGLTLSVKSFGFASSPKGRALGMTAKFPGRPQSLRVRLLPLGGAVARSAAEGVIWVRTPSVKPCRACHLPHKGGFGSAVKFLGRPQSLRFRQSLSLWERCHRR